MTNILPRLTAMIGVIAGTTLVVGVAGCVTKPPTERSVARAHALVQMEAGVSYDDDYDYYPGYETYYSRNRREYVYRDAGLWMRSPQPRDVSANVLSGAPSARMSFRDNPEHHHYTVVRNYPKNWKADDKDDRDDNRKHDNRKD